MSDTITLEIENDEETRTVTVPLDFSDFTAAEIKRVRRLFAEGDGPAELAVALIFCRTGLEDADYPEFKTELLPMFRGDPSIVTWR